MTHHLRHLRNLVIGVLAFLALGCVQVMGQAGPCMKTRALQVMLAERFNEYPVWSGMTTLGPHQGSKIVRSESPRGGWHIYVDKGEYSCLIGRGKQSHNMGFQT